MFASGILFRRVRDRAVDQIRRVTTEGGRVLIPAFSIGRAQEVLRILKGALAKGDLPPVSVHVDGMVRSVCDVYQRHPRWVSRQLEAEIRNGAHPFYTDFIQPVRSPQERSAALEQRPSVIVASSGMLSGGASVTYARALAPCVSDAILSTGYQDEESPGPALGSGTPRNRRVPGRGRDRARGQGAESQGRAVGAVHAKALGVSRDRHARGRRVSRHDDDPRMRRKERDHGGAAGFEPQTGRAACRARDVAET